MMPNKEECMNLLKEYKVPSNIQTHTLLVNKVSMIIAERLKEKGIKIDTKIVNAASLLHDILKCIDFKTFDKLNKEEIKKAEEFRKKYPNIRHEEAAYLELKDKYPEVAETIRFHKVMSINQAQTWEQKVVNYADKRASDKRIINLNERFDDFEKRYGKRIDKKIEKKHYEIEKEIFDIIGMKPGEIN